MKFTEPQAKPVTWKPRQGTKKGRPYVDLQGIPNQTIVIVLTTGALEKAHRTPQVITIRSVCIIAMSQDTDVLNFPVTTTNAPSDGTFIDTQGRKWAKYVPQTKHWQIRGKELLLGTLSLVPTGDDGSGTNEWDTTATVLDIPGSGLWHLQEDRAQNFINGTVQKMKMNELD